MPEILTLEFIERSSHNSLFTGLWSINQRNAAMICHYTVDYIVYLFPPSKNMANLSRPVKREKQIHLQ